MENRSSAGIKSKERPNRKGRENMSEVIIEISDEGKFEYFFTQ